MFTILVFLLILGFLVFVHELGHFVVARRNGIKADEFGFGFPPRVIGIVRNKKDTKWIIIRGNKEHESENTIYSLNWLPLGGFVKIKGENGDGKKDKDSFAAKPAWTRIKVLAAGVIMNFIFAWLFFSFSYMLGTPHEVESGSNVKSQILITSVEENSPASLMGIHPGDVVFDLQTQANGEKIQLQSVKDFQDYIAAHKGEKLTLSLKRGREMLDITGSPRANAENGKGLLGVGLTQVENVRYAFFPALWQGFQEVGNVIVLMADVIGKLLVGNKTDIEVTGIVGVASITGQVIPLGLAAIMRLVAIFSINLAIINALPIPALDGGRILFILIEKLKGSPVSQRVEQTFHTVGFMLLMLLMVVVTYRDLLRLDVFGKIKGIF